MKKTRPIPFISSVTTIILVIVGANLLSSGINEDSLRSCLRITAQTSLCLFLTTFIASPLHRLNKSNTSKWLMMHRRYLGITFGVSHIIHLGLILWLLNRFYQNDWSGLASSSSLITGSLGYIFIFAMLITSNNMAIKKLGHINWKRLHSFGMYTLFCIFTLTYAGLLTQNWVLNLPFIVLLVFCAILRFKARTSNFRQGVSA